MRVLQIQNPLRSFLTACRSDRQLLVQNYLIGCVTTAKCPTISIEIVVTCTYLCLAHICRRHTALCFSVTIVFILCMSCVNANRCTILTNIKEWSTDGRSDWSCYTRESTPRSSPFPSARRRSRTPTRVLNSAISTIG